MVTMGLGEPATVELTSRSATPRLDQIAALDRLVREAERVPSAPPSGSAGSRRLAQMRPVRRVPSIVGYAVLSPDSA